MCLSIEVSRPDSVLARGEHMGYQYRVTHNGSAFRCGYIQLPIWHPWHGRHYNDINTDVHGGLTFSEPDMPCNTVGEDKDWWVGFDCGHCKRVDAFAFEEYRINGYPGFYSFCDVQPLD